MRYSERYMETLKKVTEQINFGDTLKDRSFLVTGATGMIGSAFTDMLLYLNREKQLNLHVFAAVRNVNRAEKRFDGFWSSDELSFVPYRAGEEIKAEIRPDYIIHCAGNAHPTVYAEQPAETLMTNIQGTYGLLEFARNTDSVKRVLYVSSSEVYGQMPGERLYREGDCGTVDFLSARSCCSSGKRAAETLCVCFAKEYGTESVIVRPGHIYGPTMTEQDSRAASAFLRNAVQGEPILMKSAGLQKRSYCYVFDCATAMLTVLLKGIAGEAYNISNRDAIVTIRQFAEILAEEAGTEVIFEKATDKEAAGYNPMTCSALDAEKLEALGWTGQYPVREGIGDTLQILESVREK
ncbi:MAG TPA: NAD-dependent epimerase/dehydratase family protein [Candidatus Fusicatenibacter intestinigallinarum]|uniref:NAD-dependent epimerase/dehydratase family protein n=1 Tax=Candidatus Fusicatenibacter intestinigallinarum TaxID=2838598 RepID=A0A9D2N9Y3_9FIRM|nr:NAD-dependent epimerase/dehydratase family protein [Candidatus Fusicatenibacter intestinigallinarum]